MVNGTGKSKAKVAVAMSGGVDSSVAAALLKQAGYEVHGIMLRLWSASGQEDSNRCCNPDAMALARRVAEQLDIPFDIVNASEVFRQTVVQSFLDGYAAGRTPNPCLTCNRLVRWTHLLQHILSLGFDFLATGHYVRVRSNGNHYLLLRGVDRNKDQSYVLYMLNQEQLAHSLFPVGEYEKTQIRTIAASLGLPVAHAPDSQDLCFVSSEDYRHFIRRHAPELVQPGLIMTRSGTALGEHRGLIDYTIGQRKGLRLPATQRLYVLDKDIRHNRLIVGTEEELEQSEALVEAVHWITGAPPASAFRAAVKTRYTAAETWARVSVLEENRACVTFEMPQRALTPGQAAVFYEGDVVLGGGIISQAF